MIVVTVFYLILGGMALLLFRHASIRSAEAESRAIERISAFVTGGTGDVAALSRGIARKNFIHSLVFVADMLDAQARTPLRIIVRCYHIERELLNYAAKSRLASNRAYALAMLARLPLSMVTELRIERFLTDSSSQVRFYALMCIFGISPQRAVSHLARMEYRLSRSQVAELLTVMERGYCSLPYELLLMSDNYNLQLLGIHLVRRFGITESRAEIVAIVRNEKSELRQDALETLVYFGDDCCCKYNII